LYNNLAPAASPRERGAIIQSARRPVNLFLRASTPPHAALPCPKPADCADVSIRAREIREMPASA
jgi:hypothetical protein